MTSIVTSTQLMGSWWLRRHGEYEAPSKAVTITSLDNPGWRVLIHLENALAERLASPPVKTERSDADWVHLEVTNGQFIGAGGPDNLEELLSSFLSAIGEPDVTAPSALALLCRWYRERCDDAWEHRWGIDIETTGAPGWSIRVDLNETPWASMHRPEATERRSDHDWITYSVRDQKFIGEGGPENLSELVETFLSLMTPRGT